MISYERALSKVLDRVRPLGVQRVGLKQAWGTALGGDVAAPFDLPGFDNSAVDGFGVRVEDIHHATPDTPAELQLVDEIPAGKDAGQIALTSGETIKILTGAPVPPTVEAVVMKEYTTERDGVVLFTRSAKPGDNIRRQGEEYKQGQTALHRGTRVSPAVAGLLASFGLPEVEVHRRPDVAIVVTGNELVPIGQALQPGQIYESNTTALSAALGQLGITPCMTARANDDRADLRDKMGAALQQADVLLTVGGVSVGDYDLVKEVLTELGVETVFWKVAMKPGKPNLFGTLQRDGPGPHGGEQLIFGLPGNPVSALLSFHVFARPALLGLMGHRQVLNVPLRAALGRDVHKKHARAEFVRAVASCQDNQLLVTPTTGQGSHMLGGLAQANALIHLPPEPCTLSKGDAVTIELLD